MGLLLKEECMNQKQQSGDTSVGGQINRRVRQLTYLKGSMPVCATSSTLI